MRVLCAAMTRYWQQQLWLERLEVLRCNCRRVDKRHETWGRMRWIHPVWTVRDGPPEIVARGMILKRHRSLRCYHLSLADYEPKPLVLMIPCPDCGARLDNHDHIPSAWAFRPKYMQVGTEKPHEIWYLKPGHRKTPQRPADQDDLDALAKLAESGERPKPPAPQSEEGFIQKFEWLWRTSGYKFVPVRPSIQVSSAPAQEIEERVVVASFRWEYPTPPYRASHAKVKAAIDAGLSITRAAKKFKVSPATIYSRLAEIPKPTITASDLLPLRIAAGGGRIRPNFWFAHEPRASVRSTPACEDPNKPGLLLADYAVSVRPLRKPESLRGVVWVFRGNEDRTGSRRWWRTRIGTHRSAAVAGRASDPGRICLRNKHGGIGGRSLRHRPYPS
jgi:hypothetical protein